ncbi:MAG: SAM-dependent methyltransferase [Acidobacteriota bacterium]
MDADCRSLLVDRIRARGPVTVAEFMDVALYAPGAGYYARAAQRSGRAGDFVTSVDVSPLFGELLAVHVAHLWRQMSGHDASLPDTCHLVEAGAGNGRLSRDMLDGLSRREPALYDSTRLHLVERSAVARGAQPEMLGPHAARLASSSPDLPDLPSAVLIANELIDAFPAHLVSMTAAGLREVYVDLAGDLLVECLGPLSTDRLAQYFDRLGITLHVGATVDVNLAAVDWIGEASQRLGRGFVIVIDYGYQARTMYGEPGATSTLTTFARQMADPPAPGRATTPPWLVDPGHRDLTTHVDFTTLRQAAERAGLTTLSVASQSRFLLDLVERSGIVADLDRPERMRDRLALKSLLVPGGLGSSHTVLVFGKNAGVSPS